MLPGDKCLLNVYQMMAVCIVCYFWENGDMHEFGVMFLHLARAVDPLWPTGARPEACYPVFTSQEQNRTFLPASRQAPSRSRPEIRLRRLF